MNKSEPTSTTNKNTSARRHGRVYVRNTSSVELRPVVGGRPVKSIMKVLTLEDSLQASSSSPRRRRMTRFLSSRLLSMRKSSRRKVGRRTPSASVSGNNNNNNSEHSDEMEDPTRTSRVADVTTPKKNVVTFDKIVIREYGIQAEEHPGVSRGPAIGITWEYQQFDPLDVDTFEKTHPPRRKLQEIKMKLKDRMELLREAGIPKSEIDRAIKRSNIARRKRRKTVSSLKTAALEERVQGVRFKIRKVLRMNRTDEQLVDELWDKAQKTTMRTSH